MHWEKNGDNLAFMKSFMTRKQRQLMNELYILMISFFLPGPASALFVTILNNFLNILSFVKLLCKDRGQVALLCIFVTCLISFRSV